MKVEAALIQRTSGDGRAGDDSVSSDIKGFWKLLEPQYINRTLVGVLMMFFQRALYTPPRNIASLKRNCCFSEWSGINALLYYGPTLVRSMGIPGSYVSLIVAGGVGIVYG